MATLNRCLKRFTFVIHPLIIKPTVPNKRVDTASANKNFSPPYACQSNNNPDQKQQAKNYCNIAYNCLPVCHKFLPLTLPSPARGEGKSWHYPGSLPFSNIQILHFQRMGLDEISPRFYLVAHQGGKNAFGGDRIIQFYLQEFAAGRIHGGLPKLFRIHFS